MSFSNAFPGHILPLSLDLPLTKKDLLNVGQKAFLDVSSVVISRHTKSKEKSYGVFLSKLIPAPPAMMEDAESEKRHDQSKSPTVPDGPHPVRC